MSSSQSQFQSLPSLSSNHLSKKQSKEFNPTNLIALLLLFISLLFMITLSIILHSQNSQIAALNATYKAISLSSANLTSKISISKQSSNHHLMLINTLCSEVYTFSDKYDELTKKLNDLKRINEQFSRSSTKSKIMTKDERDLISKMIDANNPPKLRLVYQASSILKGDSAVVFHKRCEGIGPFVALAKIEKNIRVGGYSTAAFEIDQGSFVDPQAFVFNLDDNIKYMINQPTDKAFYYNDMLFLSFGSSDLFLTDEFFTNRFSYSTFPKSFGNPDDISLKTQLTHGITLFNVLEFELYQVINQ